ncbi:helix-turn-helix domain-containing protein [Patulibacter sp. SYSU D01012]|uniref:helix-turn-helix domain-containing protein n=1 Tax=Patulibacter sp. SYSU D01012 TaxID=2817381 RepID=UPI001B30B6FA
MSGPASARTAPVPLAPPARRAPRGPEPPLAADALLRVAEALGLAADPDRLLPAVADAAAHATGCAADLALRAGDRLVVRASAAGPTGALPPADPAPWARVLRHGRAVLVPVGAGRCAAAAPLRARAGGVIGVLAVRAEPPRDVGPETLDVVAQIAALVGGAVDDARTAARDRRRAAALERLVALVARLATVTDRAELLAATADGVRELVDAATCRVLLQDEDGALRLAARSPAATDGPAGPAPGGAATVRLPDGAGAVSVERAAALEDHEREMLGTVAAQLAAALRTADALERLTEEHLVRALFAAIAEGRADRVAERARSARVDPDRPHVVAVFAPLDRGAAWDRAARLERRLRQTVPGVLCDPGPDRLRALLPVPDGGAAGLAALDAALDRLAHEEAAAAGRSPVQPGLAAGRSSLTEAASAARVARALAPEGGCRAWEDLGVYRYLVGVGGEAEPDARHARAVRRLWEYDRKRGSELVRTLERYLADRSVVPTARALCIHPNTLRQRLERIEHLTALTVADEDLLSLELAVKLHRLRAAEAGAA